MKKIILFCFFWLCWGFSLGTFILLFPLRYTVDYARDYEWSAYSENLVVFLYIAALAIISFLLARTTVNNFKDSYTSKGIKTGHIILPIVVAIGALYVMMNPSLNNMNTVSLEINTQFTIGPYPDKKKIAQLKDEGYTAIISLLHPAVAPFEPKLLNEEQDYAKAERLQVISIPMLPWVSKNEDAIDSLRKIAKKAKGKYYIHCYLGKDRVNVARRIIEQESNDKITFEAGMLRRSIDTMKAFERGMIYKLEDSVYLTPLPTDEEYFGYIVAASFRQIVSLADLSDPASQAQAENERKMLAVYNIPFQLFDINDMATDKRIVSIVDSVRVLKKPILIHAFNSQQPLAQRFKIAWNQ